MGTGDPLDDVELFEATGDGVHVYNLVGRLRDDPKMNKRYVTIALRKLVCQRTPEMLDAIDDAIAEFRGLPFEQDREALQKALLRKRGSRDVSSIYCAELTAECLQAIGVLSCDRASNEYLP